MFLDLFLFDGEGEASADSSPASANTETATQDDGWTKAKEQYKDQYSSEVSNIVKERLKKSKAKEAEDAERLSKYDALHKSLTRRYGTDDLVELENKVRNDEAWIHSEAVRRGMSDEATRLQMEIEYRDEKERAFQEAQAREQKLQADVMRWRGEEAELKNTFPNFDLNEEFENPKFFSLLVNGWDLKGAYMAVHADDIIKGSTQIAYEKGRESLANSLQANALRPTANGVSSQGAITQKFNFKNMSDEEFDKFRSEVESGKRKL